MSPLKGSAATSRGEDNNANTASLPSPLLEEELLPATVVMMPVLLVTIRITLFNLSAMYRLPVIVSSDIPHTVIATDAVCPTYEALLVLPPPAYENIVPPAGNPNCGGVIGKRQQIEMSSTDQDGH